MAPSLSGRRVVVTRSAEDNAPLAATVEALGAEVVKLPLIEVVDPADDGAAIRAAVKRLTDYRYVTLTSTNAVRAVVSALDGQPWPDSVEVVPVGPVTAALAGDAGMTVGPVPSSATAADLVREFPVWTGDEPCRVLAPLAELAGDTVVSGLAEKGYLVDRVEAYRTVTPHADVLSVGLAALQGRADAVLFFSPSAVDRFVALGQATGTWPEVAICVGPSTGDRAAKDRRWEVVVANPHTEAGVITALREVFGCGEPAAQS